MGPGRAVAGDAVLVSGPVGDHGIAVMAAREGIDFETALVSDSAPVVALVRALLDAVPDTHVLRDPTRGGLATALCEIALSSNVGIRLEEAEIPVREEVRGACELLGFDPLYVACEGRFLAIVPGERAEAALARDPLAARRRGGAADRLGGRRGPRPPGAADADRQPPPARAALRRAAAEDLLAEGRLDARVLRSCRAMVDRVEREARAAQRRRHRSRLAVRIGAMSGVEPELFASAFTLCREGILAEAELEIRRAEAAWGCPACAAAIPAGAVLRCAACGAPAKLLSGDEILLEQIEMEVP